MRSKNLLASVVLAFLCFARLASAEMVDRVVAVVNDDEITQSDVDTFKKRLATNGLLDQGLLSLYDRSKLEKDNKALVNFLIDEKTIDSAVKDEGIVSPIEQVESEITNIVHSRGIDRDQLKEALKKQGITYAEYQDFIKTSLQRQTLLQKEVSSKIKISDDEINAFYSAQKNNKNPLVFEYTLSHLFFADSNGGPAAAHERAEEVKKKLDQGLPFDALISQYSEDKNYNENGVFGTFRLSDFNPEVRAVMEHLNAGDVSPVVKMPDGYHIFKVLKKVLVPSPDLEAKREQIRQYLTNLNFKRQFRAWLDQKRAEAFIRIYLPDEKSKS